MTPKEGILSSMPHYLGSEKVFVGNSSLFPTANIDSLTIKTHSKPLLIHSILYVP